jgi:hypothetical protein
VHQLGRAGGLIYGGGPAWRRAQAPSIEGIDVLGTKLLG